MTNSVKSIFSEIEFLDAYKRINPNYILDLFLGVNQINQYTLLVLSTKELKPFKSTTLINCIIAIRKDGNYALTISLKDEKYLDIFSTMCEDLVSFSVATKIYDKALERLYIRYNEWVKLFGKKPIELLSYPEMKGLLGELLCIKSYLIHNYTSEDIINSWIGPDYADQDFIFSDMWYEVKTTVSGATSVKISSVEQLDTGNDGKLVIVYLDKSSIADSNRITLNALVDEIENIFIDEDSKIKYRNLLLSNGYFKDEYYDQFSFKLSNINLYNVCATFPCIRKKQLPNTVSNVHYDLMLNSISLFKEE